MLDGVGLTTWDMQNLSRRHRVPGLARHWSNISRQAVRGGWLRQPNPRRRTGYLYRMSTLPAVTRAWIIANRDLFLNWLASRHGLPPELLALGGHEQAPRPGPRSRPPRPSRRASRWPSSTPGRSGSAAPRS